MLRCVAITCFIASLGLIGSLTRGEVFAQSGASASPETTRHPGLNLDMLRANNFEVVMLDGRRTKLAELLGRNRPVLIEFWATWCAPCRRTMPHLDELGRKYDKQGLIVIGLTVEAPERDLDKVKELVQQLRINYPVAFATPPLYSFFSEGHARIGVPRVFVFARDGRLIKQINGYNPLNTLGKITNAVKQAALADVVLPKQK